jgi:Domain of unknown function (DUF4440)
MSLDRFFSRYAELSMGPHPEALAGVYAPTFIVAGPEGSHAFANDGDFLEWLRQIAAFNREHGMRTLTVVSIRHIELSPLHTLATVTWGARFDKTGDRMIEFAISYLLEKSDGDWRILSYISRTDQNAEMAKEGLL